MPAGSVNLVSPVSPRLISDLQPGHVGFLTSLSLNSHSRRNPRPPPSFRCCKSRGVNRAVHPGCCSRAPRGLPLLRRGSRTVSDSRSRSAPRVKALRGEEASPGRGVWVTADWPLFLPARRSTTTTISCRRWDRTLFLLCFASSRIWWLVFFTTGSRVLYVLY